MIYIDILLNRLIKIIDLIIKTIINFYIILKGRDK